MTISNKYFFIEFCKYFAARQAAEAKVSVVKRVIYFFKGFFVYTRSLQRGISGSGAKRSGISELQKRQSINEKAEEKTVYEVWVATRLQFKKANFPCKTGKKQGNSHILDHFSRFVSIFKQNPPIQIQRPIKNSLRNLTGNFN